MNAAPLRPHPTGRELISVERTRQLLFECYSAEYDSRFVDGELERAAYCYVQAAAIASDSGFLEAAPAGWPRGFSWRPSRDAVRNMVKAGALFCAEVDRATLAGNQAVALRCEAAREECAAEIDRLMTGELRRGVSAV